MVNQKTSEVETKARHKAERKAANATLRQQKGVRTKAEAKAERQRQYSDSSGRL